MIKIQDLVKHLNDLVLNDDLLNQFVSEQVATQFGLKMNENEDETEEYIRSALETHVISYVLNTMITTLDHSFTERSN